MTRAPSNDRKESPEDERRGMELLVAGFRRYESLSERASLFDTAPGSLLEGDDEATIYNPISHQLLTSIGVATDHLHGVQIAVEDSDGKILTMAYFTLIRSALEAAGNGLWITHPASRDGRVLRSLQLTRDARQSVSFAIKETGEDDPNFERVESRLKELRDQRPGLIGRNLKPASVTARLRSIHELVPKLWMPPLLLWQLASGAAHGNSAMLQNLLDHELRSSDEVGGEYEVTTSVVLLALFYQGALDMLEAALDRRDELGGQKQLQRE